MNWLWIVGRYSDTSFAFLTALTVFCCKSVAEVREEFRDGGWVCRTLTVKSYGPAIASSGCCFARFLLIVTWEKLKIAVSDQ